MDDDADPGDRTPGDATGIVGPEHLHAMLGFLTQAVYVYDRNGDLKARLGPPGGLLGYDADAGSNIFTHMHPDDVPRGMEIGAAVNEAEAGWAADMIVRLRHADGGWRRYQIRVSNEFANPELEGMVGVLRELPPDDDAAEPDDLGLLSISDDLPTAYLALGQGSRIRFASEAALELLSCGRADLIGLPVAELVADHDRPVVKAAYAALLDHPGARTVVATTRPRFGARALEAEFHTRGTDAEHKVITVVLVDHTDEPELVRLATHDALTGLANRTKIIESITGLLLDPDPILSVVYVDLDDLKAINDAHGHEAGDRALIGVAHRLQELVRPGDLCGRMSGDEFVLVCPGLDGTALMHFVERVGSATWGDRSIIAPDGAPMTISISAGGATAVAGDTTSTLLSRSDEAMFAAKRRHL